MTREIDMTRDTDTHLVVIGNGMAGHRLVTTLLARKDRPARITVLGEEASHAYNRILLSPGWPVSWAAMNLPCPPWSPRASSAGRGSG